VALDRDPAEVVLAIGIIVGIELIIAPQRRDDLVLGLGPERRNRPRTMTLPPLRLVRKASLRVRMRSVCGLVQRQWSVTVGSYTTVNAIDRAALDGVWQWMEG
jgi:hypothetical protein